MKLIISILLCIGITSCQPKVYQIKESKMVWVFANYAEIQENEILAAYQDSLYQVYFDVKLKQAYINHKNERIYIKR